MEGAPLPPPPAGDPPEMDGLLMDTDVAEATSSGRPAQPGAHRSHRATHPQHHEQRDKTLHIDSHAAAHTPHHPPQPHPSHSRHSHLP
eukprot:scaffold27521_cov30-Tisochrysis_lutea.AAC.3